MSRLAMEWLRKGVLAASVLAVIPSGADAAKVLAKGYLAILITATNTHRTQNGLPQIKFNAQLNAAADQYARYLSDHNADGHTADGRTPAQRITAQGYSFCFYAENMFSYWGTSPISASTVASKAVEWWKQSPGHNANMLNPKAKEIGVGMYSAYIGGKTIWKAVQVFAAPC